MIAVRLISDCKYDDRFKAMGADDYQYSFSYNGTRQELVAKILSDIGVDSNAMTEFDVDDECGYMTMSFEKENISFTVDAEIEL